MASRLVVSEKEMDDVLKLDGQQRYDYFIKRVADWEQAWGLWQDGWALFADDGGRGAFPLWPAREYAESCMTGEWSSYRPTEIQLEDLVGELLGRLASDGTLVVAFPTPQSKGVVVDAERVRADLLEECEKYD
jgi:hypothetical protein